MLITKTTQGIVNRFNTASRRAVGRSGKLLGGKRWIGALTLLCALCSGPILQFAFRTMRFDATAVRHQTLAETFRVFRSGAVRKAGERSLT